MPKKLLILVWIICLLLAGHDLGIMAGSISFGLIVFATFLLTLFSIPFLIAYQSLSKRDSNLPRFLQIIFGVGICGFSLFLPCLRYFPGYKPDALESLKYLFGPLFFEGGFIVIIFGTAALFKHFFQKK